VLWNVHAIKQIRSSFSDGLNDGVSCWGQVGQSSLADDTLNKEECQLSVHNFKSI
jgi:hypothetical protein